MPTNLPPIAKSIRKLDVSAMLFLVFYLTCFVIMIIDTLPLLAETLAIASP